MLLLLLRVDGWMDGSIGKEGGEVEGGSSVAHFR